MSQLSVLPAFNGADESSAFITYSLCPDPDGHSIWALMLYWGNLPDNVPSGPDVQYNIVKIDLLTKQITKKWNYDGSGGMPLGCIEGSSFFFIDHAGMIWTAGGPAPGNMQQNDPNSGFALVNSFGQSGNSSAAEYLDSLSHHSSPSWVNWVVGGTEYMAYHATQSSWESMIVVCNLTTGHVVGNFWVHEGFGNTFSDPAFTVELGQGDLFVDASGNLWWVMEELNTGGLGNSANAWFFKWNPSDGTKAQPIRTVTLADPFLNNVTWTVVPSSRYNSTGTWTSNGTDLRAQYIPSKNYVALGKAQRGVGSGYGGDVSILDMNGLAFTQVAIVPTADPAFMLYAPDSGEDIGAYQWQDNSKRPGLSNTNIIVSSSGPAGGTDAVGKASLLSSSDLSILKSFDLNGAILAADPLYVAGFHWCYNWPADNLLSGGQYIPGDLVMLATFGANDHLYIAKNTMSYPAATSPAADPTNWTDVAPGTSLPGGSGLVYRGIYDATLTYHAKDVVVREDYVGNRIGRPFTAMADSVGVDPIVSGSDFWFPATNSPWYTWLQPTFPNTRASCGGPLAHMLYYEALDILVWTYDFLGSPLYMLSSPGTGIIRVQKTVVSGTPADHTYPFTMRPSWKPPFTLVDGGSDVSTVPAGTYSLAEDPVALINEAIVISNGDPPSAIVVAPGDAIVIAVTNTRSVPGPPGGTSFVPKPPIGHGPFQVVPTDNSPNQAWQVSVSVNNKSIPLGVVLRYNEIAKYWVATISDSQGNVLLDSIPLITGDNFTQNILRQFAYLGIGSAAIFNASAKSA